MNASRSRHSAGKSVAKTGDGEVLLVGCVGESSGPLVNGRREASLIAGEAE
ncbi:hypothetical protein HU742_011995 [Pseudomonas sp. SWRI102]|uniref:Uncharacterized protein n=1 Tax=Pseudomonas marvdashtae TaxID=2745500 RepID=A0A923FNR0_9PSED|nr:hypothetical protein [Pseudomonas marvdashtae]MBV4551861.1 hypothetical protein [Pseudomonas marvdashtae]